MYKLAKKDTYDKIEKAVRKYWKEHYPQEVVAFFYQKYSFEDNWRWHQELVKTDSMEGNTVIFLNDFNEGETDIKDLKIVSLEEVLDYYVENKMR